MKKIALLFSLALLSFASCKTENTDPCDNVKYSNNIKALISTSCNSESCHAANNTKQLPEFDTHAKLDATKIRKRIFDLKDMPPAAAISAGNAKELTDKQKADLKCWLDNGAKDD